MATFVTKITSTLHTDESMLNLNILYFDRRDKYRSVAKLTDGIAFLELGRLNSILKIPHVYQKIHCLLQ